MTKSGTSVFYFGIYLLLTGVLLCTIPDTFISTLKLPEIPSPWARLFGIVVFILGCYYLIGGKNDLKPFIKGTIYLRLLFVAGALMLIVSGQMPMELIPLGIIDALGAAWTALALKGETKSS